MDYEKVRKHAIHAAVVLVVLWLGSILFPQFYHFANVGALFLTTAAYMAVYLAFIAIYGYIVTKVDVITNGFVFNLFIILDFLPGIIALYLMATLFAGFWACSPWLIAIILSAICESIYMLGAYIREQ